jgi:hypothetical protein
VDSLYPERTSPVKRWIDRRSVRNVPFCNLCRRERHISNLLQATLPLRCRDFLAGTNSIRPAVCYKRLCRFVAETRRGRPVHRPDRSPCYKRLCRFVAETLGRWLQALGRAFYHKRLCRFVAGTIILMTTLSHRVDDLEKTCLQNFPGKFLPLPFSRLTSSDDAAGAIELRRPFARLRGRRNSRGAIQLCARRVSPLRCGDTAWQSQARRCHIQIWDGCLSIASLARDRVDRVTRAMQLPPH